MNGIVAQWEADAATFINRGICYSELGNDEKAVQSFLKALTIDPENRKALLYLANSFLRMGNLAEAENRYSQFIEKGGKGAEAERVKKILNILKNET